jgi:hypothetical protein
LYYAAERGEYKGNKNETAEDDLTCCIHKPLLSYAPLVAFFIGSDFWIYIKIML